MRTFNRIISFCICFVITISSFSASFSARAYSISDLMLDSISDWMAGFSGNNSGVWNVIDPLSGMVTGVNRPAVSSKPQKYYTTPTSSVQDKYGNVTNYYRSRDTSNTQIIDSYNKTFNTIHNTTNNTTTNNYKTNVKLENFLNQYTTNNNNYTYSADIIWIGSTLLHLPLKLLLIFPTIATATNGCPCASPSPAGSCTISSTATW